MPIRPENKKHYGTCWKFIRLLVLERAKNACEWCGVENYELHTITGSKVILTIAHLDHNPANHLPANLAALCQKCHNSHDAQNRAENRKKRRESNR